jgi:hypothetical protein
MTANKIEGSKALNIIVNLDDALFHLIRIGVGLPNESCICLSEEIVEQLDTNRLSKLIGREMD